MSVKIIIRHCEVCGLRLHDEHLRTSDGHWLCAQHKAEKAGREAKTPTITLPVSLPIPSAPADVDIDAVVRKLGKLEGMVLQHRTQLQQHDEWMKPVGDIPTPAQDSADPLALIGAGLSQLSSRLDTLMGQQQEILHRLTQLEYDATVAAAKLKDNQESMSTHRSGLTIWQRLTWLFVGHE